MIASPPAAANTVVAIVCAANNIRAVTDTKVMKTPVNPAKKLFSTKLTISGPKNKVLNSVLVLSRPVPLKVVIGWTAPTLLLKVA